MEAANLADSRASADTDEITKLATIANDAANSDNAKKEAAILAEQQLRQSDAAANGDQQITQVQSDFGSAIGATAKAQDDYASAGRRSLINRIGTKSFLETILTKASAELNAAQATVKTLSDASATLQLQYNTLVGDYTNRMNDMAAAFREFTARNKEAQTRQDIKDFASTPYLYLADNAAGTAGLASNVGDAQNMFNSAKTALDAINKQLTAAADLVFAEDHMSDFATVAAAVSSAKKAGTDPASLYPPLSTAEAKTLADLRAKAVKLVDDQGNKIAIDGTTGTPLSVSERDQLTALTQRELYANYADVFTTRAEFLEQSLRTIRIEKAAAILQSEIAKRSAAVQESKATFESALNSAFSYSPQPGREAEAKQAQLAVYRRLSNLQANGVTNFFNEFRAWFWGGGQWMKDFGSDMQNTVQGEFLKQAPLHYQVSRSQIFEAALGQNDAAAMSQDDVKAIGTFLGAGGVFSEFSGFSGVYMKFLESLGAVDAAFDSDLATKAIFIPLMSAGQILVGTGSALIAQGTALILMGGSLLITQGTGLVIAGTAMVHTSLSRLISSQISLTVLAFNSLDKANAAHASSTDNVMNGLNRKEKVYAQALAELDYFTKIPDMQTLKHRLIEWGKGHKDDTDPNSALYNLTDDDIKYLYDAMVGLRDSNGNQITLSTGESSNALDAGSKKKDMSFTDTLGNAYDPNAPMLDTAPGPLVNGTFQGPSGKKYTKIYVMGDDGRQTEKYALVIPGNGQTKGFDLQDILPMLVNRMEGIRDAAKGAYLIAGQKSSADTGDTAFVLNQQSEVLETILKESIDRKNGGREFSGYTNSYGDFAQNAQAISDMELKQRVDLQKQEWDLRDQDFRDRRAEWETKIGNILDRGKKEWAENQSKFLQQWDDWEKKFDKDTKDGQAAWDAKTAQFFADRTAWRNSAALQQAQQNVSESVTGILTSLESQLQMFAANLGTDVHMMDSKSAIAQIMTDIEKGMPKNTDRLRDINNDISNFNTQLALSQMSGQDITSGISGLQGNFQKAMLDNQKQMTILAGTQMFEQYRKIREQFLAYIEDQNIEIQRKTDNAALAEGFHIEGDTLVKDSAAAAFSGAPIRGTVHRYHFYETASALAEELTKTGFSEMSGTALTNFLSNKSEVEMDSYFSMQKVALEAAMETIVGSGSQTDRKIKRDKETIGMFGIWVGDAGDQQTAGTVSAVLPKDLDPAQVDTGMWYAFAGFGELGSTGARPGGPMLGFFPELQLALRYIGQSESLATQNALKNIDMSSVSRSAALGGGASGFGTSLPGIADAMKTIYANDSYSTMLAKVGPALAQAGFNTAMSSGISSVGARLGDSPLGIMADQYNPLNMYANARYNVAMGEENGYKNGNLWNAQWMGMAKSVLGAVDQGLISSAIDANTQTGETGFHYTKQDKEELFNKLRYGGMVGGYMNSQEKWDSDGNQVIGHTSGTEKDAALIRSIFGAAPIIGGTLSEYIVQQWEGENLSGYKNLAYTGLEGMGNIVGLVVMAFSLSNSIQPGSMGDLAADAAAKGALDFGTTNSVAQVFQGIALVLEDLLKKGANYLTGGLMDVIDGKMSFGDFVTGKIPYAKTLASVFNGAWNAIAGLFGGGDDAPFRSDEELQKYMLEKKLAAGVKDDLQRNAVAQETGIKADDLVPVIHEKQVVYLDTTTGNVLDQEGKIIKSNLPGSVTVLGGEGQTVDGSASPDSSPRYQIGDRVFRSMTEQERTTLFRLELDNIRMQRNMGAMGDQEFAQRAQEISQKYASHIGSPNNFNPNLMVEIAMPNAGRSRILLANDNYVEQFKSYASDMGYTWNDKGINLIGIRFPSTSGPGSQPNNDLFLLIKDNQAIGLIPGSTETGLRAQDPFTSSQSVGQYIGGKTVRLPEGNYTFLPGDSPGGFFHSRVLTPADNLMGLIDSNDDGKITGDEVKLSNMRNSFKSIWIHNGTENAFSPVQNYSLGCQTPSNQMYLNMQTKELTVFSSQQTLAPTHGAFGRMMDQIPNGSTVNYILLNNSRMRSQADLLRDQLLTSYRNRPR